VAMQKTDLEDMGVGSGSMRRDCIRDRRPRHGV
jgi:hypothetical protein